MLIVQSFGVAVVLCIVTMMCWGSHVNALKMLPRSYAFSYYYWDHAIGYLLLSLIVGLTLGSFGSTGRDLLSDLGQGSLHSYGMAILGGVVFNLANILLISATSIAGIAVAFPIGLGIAVVEGIVINYIAEPKGNALLIFGGAALITVAIVFDAFAYKSIKQKRDARELKLGVILAAVSGMLMGSFYYLVQRSLSLDFKKLDPGRFGPYAAVLIFSLGLFASNFVYNSYLMAHPLSGSAVKYSGFFTKGMSKLHLIGVLGGLINATGMLSNIVASKTASPAIAYGLGQGGTMVAAIWGVFVWKEFKGASRGTYVMIAVMFCLFISGLALLVLSML
ncbi:MAG: GRP family sugar transporter [Terriglobales bacterium]|jgi:glucose uptake protein